MKQDIKDNTHYPLELNIAYRKIYELRVALNAVKIITKRGQVYDIAKRALK